MKRALVALGSIALLAGCGSGNDSAYTSAKDVATAAGCTQPKPADQPTLYATDEVTCTHAGRYIQVDWFKDTDSLASFKTASKGSGYVILYGSDWAVSCIDNKNDCAAFKEKLGGSLG